MVGHVYTLAAAQATPVKLARDVGSTKPGKTSDLSVLAKGGARAVADSAQAQNATSWKHVTPRYSSLALLPESSKWADMRRG